SVGSTCTSSKISALMPPSWRSERTRSGRPSFMIPRSVTISVCFTPDRLRSYATSLVAPGPTFTGVISIVKTVSLGISRQPMLSSFFLVVERFGGETDLLDLLGIMPEDERRGTHICEGTDALDGRQPSQAMPDSW